MGWAPNRLRNIIPPLVLILVLVYGILALLVWGRVLAAFQLHYMEVGHLMLDEDVRPKSVQLLALSVS